MTPAVMRDDAIAMLEEKHHLRIPVIGRQRPAMAEHDGLTFAPVLVEDLDAVFGRNRIHACLLRGLLTLTVTTTIRGVHDRVGPKSTLGVRDRHVCLTFQSGSAIGPCASGIPVLLRVH